MRGFDSAFVETLCGESVFKGASELLPSVSLDYLRCERTGSTDVPPEANAWPPCEFSFKLELPRASVGAQNVKQASAPVNRDMVESKQSLLWYLDARSQSWRAHRSREGDGLRRCRQCIDPRWTRKEQNLCSSQQGLAPAHVLAAGQ
jgi:hypothetical protein